MSDAFIAVAVGLAAGVLSGAFGVGGGVILVPGMRILVGVPALTAVGTSLAVIIPSAATASIAYLRARSSDWRRGLVIGVTGMPFASAGAWFAEQAGGLIVLVLLAIVIVYSAGDTALQVYRPRVRVTEEGVLLKAEAPRWPVVAVIGAVAGVFGGFLGLGGGFIIVPLLTRLERLPIKIAIGTSLIAIIIIAIPGTVTHMLLGNVEMRLAAAVALGIVPGAILGSKVTLAAHERHVRLAFAAMLLLVAPILVAREVGVL